MLQGLKAKFRKKRTSSNVFFRGIFFARDKVEEFRSGTLDIAVLWLGKKRKFNVKEISNNPPFKNVSGRYSFFGEFGYFQFITLGGLSQYFKIHPREKIEVITYEDYGKLLELMFPENVKAYYTDYVFDEKLRSCHFYCDRKFRMALRKLGFGKSVTKDLIYKTKELPKIPFESGGDYFYHMTEPLNYPLRKEYQGGKFISIFPRFRKAGTDRNLSEEEWNKIVELISKYPYKIVMHGYSSEFIKLKNENLIFPKDIFDQIAFLNNSILCITTFSGFQHFSENCGCDIFVIINGKIHSESFKEHRKFNPFGTKIYSCSEDEDYLGQLKKILDKSKGGVFNGKYRKGN